MKYKNTLQKGSIRVLVFQEGTSWYAVGLEFNIVEVGTTPQEAMLLLFEAIAGYVESAKKIKARPHILNQSAGREYEIKWKEASTPRPEKRKSESVYFAGRVNLGKVGALVPA